MSSDQSTRRFDELLAELDALPDSEIQTSLPNYERKRQRLKAPSPNPREWAASVPELKSVPGLGS
jgi:hypothetical protein